MKKKKIIRGFIRLSRSFTEAPVYVRIPCASRISSKIISRQLGTHYVNEAVVKATSRLFFHARTGGRRLKAFGSFTTTCTSNFTIRNVFAPDALCEVSTAVTRLLPTGHLSFRSCLHRTTMQFAWTKLPVLVSRDLNRFVHFDSAEIFEI